MTKAEDNGEVRRVKYSMWRRFSFSTTIHAMYAEPSRTEPSNARRPEAKPEGNGDGPGPLCRSGNAAKRSGKLQGGRL